MQSQRVFAVFQGGGARGMAHLGAIKAARDAKIEFLGVAGTSAGALVAALIGVGFKATEIFDPKSPQSNVLATYDTAPTLILGKTEWEDLQRIAKRFRAMLVAMCGGGVLASWVASPLGLARIFNALEAQGHFKTTKIISLINQILHDKLCALHNERGSRFQPDDGIVRFKHLDETRLAPDVVPLKIVASDISTKRARVFSREDTPEISVASAVCASTAIPYVFQPVQIELDGAPFPHVDGGLVANLPVWAFEREREALERADPEGIRIPTLAFILRNPADSAAAASKVAQKSGFARWNPADFIGALSQLMMGGSQQIAVDLITNLEIVPVETKLNLLNFDAPLTELQLAFEDGYDSASHYFQSRPFVRAGTVEKELSALDLQLRKRVSASGQPLKRGQKLRYQVLEKINPRYMRPVYNFNFSGDADDRLLVDMDFFGAPSAYNSKRIVTVGADELAENRRRMNKYERIKKPVDVNFQICIPIFDDQNEWTKDPEDRTNPPKAVLVVDSPLRLSEFSSSNAVLTILTLASISVGNAMSGGRDVIETRPN